MMKNNKEMKDLDKINFFSDLPLTADNEKEAKFGHPSIANNIKKIILACPLPFTIGLFGRWGTGKSTIINILIKKLRETSNEIAIANVDAWKYEGDSLRRQFLITLDKELKLGNKYEDELCQTLTTTDPTKGHIKFDLGLFFNIFSIIALFLLFGGFFSKIIWKTSNLVTNLSDFMIQFGLFGFLLQLMVGFFRRVGVEVTEHRTDSAEGFEKRFIEEVLNNNKIKNKERLVIIIDNLDRCSHGKAVELLSTIKTFLAKDLESKHNKCVFLIACDDGAVKKHIESIYLNEQNSIDSGPFKADEFLRKFFNVFIRIPHFIDTELQTYTESLLEETCVSQLNSQDVAFVITTSFRDNPRQIKQFINTLLAHFLLAKEREESPEPLIVPEGSITNNIAFLAKIMIIRQRFPYIYQRVLNEQLTVEEMESYIAIDSKSKEEEKEFKSFLRSTKRVTTNDVRPFIYLKQSQEELNISGIKEIELGLIDNQIEVVVKKLSKIKTDHEQIEHIKKFIPNLINKNRGRKQTLLNIVTCSLDAISQNNIELSPDFYNNVAELLVDDNLLKSDLPSLKPSLVFERVLTKCNQYDKKAIISQYIALFTRQKGTEELPKPNIEFSKQVLIAFINNKEWVSHKLAEIKRAITEHYYAELEMLSLLKDRDDNEDFISDTAVKKLIETFSEQDVENQNSLKEKNDLLLDFINVSNVAVADTYLLTAQKLLHGEIPKIYRAESDNLLDCIVRFLKRYKTLIGKIQSKDSINALTDTVLQGLAKGSWPERKIFIRSCFALQELVDAPRLSKLETYIQNFFTNTDMDSMKYIIDPLKSDERKALIVKYESNFEQRILQDQTMLDYLYEIASADVRTKWLVTIINSSDIARGLKMLDDLKYKIDNSKEVVNALLSKVKSVDTKAKSNFYNAINKMRCGKSPELYPELTLQIKSLLQNPDQGMQEVGVITYREAKYLTETVKRDIMRETIEWLDTLEPDSAYQILTVECIVNNLSIVKSQRPLLDKFIDFLFNKLITKGINVETIKLGFKALVDIKPSISDYNAYFEDVYAKAESESDTNIKKEIVDGLTKLMDKDDKEFRKRVDKLLK